MRLDDVEIKVSFRQGETEAAVQALHLPDDRPAWQIYFCEDVNRGVGVRTPLVDLGVVLRARVRSGDDDATVKLRPCRRSQLSDRWLAETAHVKVEADWAGDRHQLAVANTDDRPDGLIPAVLAGERPVRDLFATHQREFLLECAGVVVNLETVTVLPAIRAVRWKAVPGSPPELDLRAERWTVGPLDFLELSLVAPPEEAASRQAALVRFVESRGLVAPPDAEAKTQQVMRHLVEASLAAP